MNKKAFVLGMAAGLTITTLLLMASCVKKNKQQKLATVSDAGYETAYDIHYPLKHNKPGRNVKS